MTKLASISFMVFFLSIFASVNAQVKTSFLQRTGEQPELDQRQSSQSTTLAALLKEYLEKKDKEEGLSPFARSWGLFIQHEIYRDPNWNLAGQQGNINLATPWIDASVIYGSNEHQAHWLRTFSGGRLYEVDTTDLPYDRLDHQVNPSLLALHSLFVQEHNRICSQLSIGGYTDDEEMYQRARNRVTALVQNITFQEFLPAIGIELPAYTGYQSEPVDWYVFKNTNTVEMLTSQFLMLRNIDEYYFEHHPNLDSRLIEDLKQTQFNDVLDRHLAAKVLFTKEPKQVDFDLIPEGKYTAITFSSPATLDIFPNPSIGPLSIRINSFEISSAKLKITDMQGRLVHPIINLDLSGDFHLEELSLSLSKGTYLVNFISSYYVETRQLVMQ
ncbi:MAG: peroxidase family protein [Bacteroidota bacterium]